MWFIQRNKKRNGCLLRAPKASALPTALIPDFGLLSFAPDVVKHVVRRIFWPHRLTGKLPVSQAYQGIADIAFSGSKGERPAPKASALPTALIPDMKFRLIRRPDVLTQECVCKWLRHRTWPQYTWLAAKGRNADERLSSILLKSAAKSSPI